MFRTRVIAANANYPDEYHNWAPWNRLANLAIARAGHHLDVVAPRPYALDIPGFPNREIARLPLHLAAEEGIVHYPRFLYAFPKRLFYALAGESYRSRVTAYVRANIRKPDVIHAHHLYLDGYGMLPLAREWKVPLVVDVHGDDVFSYHLLDRSTGSKWQSALLRADAVVCVSERLRTSAVQAGVPADRAHYVPLGVDVDRFHPRQRGDAKSRIGMGTRFMCLYVGQLIERKGVGDLISALAQLPAETRGQIVLAIVGSGPERLALERMAFSLGVEKEVHFAGRVSNEVLPEWFAAADVFALASYSEGRPTVINEAMASGCAVLASNVSGVPEQVVDGETGYLFAPGDIPRIATLIAKLSQDSVATIRLGANGRRRVLEQEWTWPAYARRVSLVYQDAIERSASHTNV